MNTMKTIIILIVSFVLFSYTINAEDEKKATVTQDENVGIEVLKERIKGNEKQANIQLKALDEKINNQQKTLTEKIASKSKSLEREMYIYTSFVVGLIAIIGFIGFKTIRSWIMQTIESKTDDEVNKYVTPELIKDLLEEKGDDAVSKLLSGLEAKAKQRLSELDERFAKLDDLQNEYTASLADLRAMQIDISIPATEEITNKLKQFEENISLVKTEDKYTYDDWYYKALSEYDNKEYDDAIISCTKLIEMDSANYAGYNCRGIVYSAIKQYDEGL